jgi:hypothetical protein
LAGVVTFDSQLTSFANEGCKQHTMVSQENKSRQGHPDMYELQQTTAVIMACHQQN